MVISTPVALLLWYRHCHQMRSRISSELGVGASQPGVTYFHINGLDYLPFKDEVRVSVVDSRNSKKRV